LPAIDDWMNQNAPNSSIFIISAELYLYGGLISSRITNDSTSSVEQRLEKLINFKKLNANLKIYLATGTLQREVIKNNFQ
jgi:hypothetical protein